MCRLTCTVVGACSLLAAGSMAEPIYKKCGSLIWAIEWSSCFSCPTMRHNVHLRGRLPLSRHDCRWPLLYVPWSVDFYGCLCRSESVLVMCALAASCQFVHVLKALGAITLLGERLSCEPALPLNSAFVATSGPAKPDMVKSAWRYERCPATIRT